MCPRSFTPVLQRFFPSEGFGAPMAGAAVLLLTAAPSAFAAPPHYDHVVVVLEENHTEAQIIGDTANAPYINSLAAGGITVGQMFALQHPSQPNYLQLFSGSDQGVKNDAYPREFSATPTDAYPFSSPNLGAELIAAGRSFGSFSEQLELAEDKDYADYDGSGAGNFYRRKHNPCVNWVAKVLPVPPNQLPPGVNLPFTSFPSDFSTLPTVSFVIPNLMNDMHDGSRPMGDSWLRTNLDAYAQWAKTHNSLLIITWDEDDFNATNQIPTVLHGAGLAEGTTAPGTWTQHNILRTLEECAGLTSHAGSAARVRAIAGAFNQDPPVSVLRLRQGLNAYALARDTMISKDQPAAACGSAEDLFVDKDPGGADPAEQTGQALLCFDSLFGGAINQVPSGAVILSAKLLIHTPPNAGGSANQSVQPVDLHRMIRSWSDSDTWDSLEDGVSTDDTEAAASATFSVTPSVPGAPAIFDVTADLEQFQNGSAVNQGWLLRMPGTGNKDRWTFKSSEAGADPALRPTLEIVYSQPMADSYTAWASASGLTGADALANADPDHDGAENLTEFAFNLDPRIPDNQGSGSSGTRGLPSPGVASLPGGPALEISFLHRKTPAAPALTYSAQFSSDLTSWSGGLTASVSPINTGWERLTVRDSHPPAPGSKRYARLLLTLAP